MTDLIIHAFHRREPIDGLYILPVKVESRLDGLGVRKQTVTGTMPCWSPLLGRFHVKPEWVS